MNKQDKVLQEVFDVYGYDLEDSRTLFNATSKSPVSTSTITKQFKSWKRFYQQYLTYCSNKRSMEKKVVTKKEVSASGSKDD